MSAANQQLRSLMHRWHDALELQEALADQYVAALASADPEATSRASEMLRINCATWTPY